MFKHPRNAPCICGSGKKWKKCCERPRESAIEQLKLAASIYNRSERKRKRGYPQPSGLSRSALITMGAMCITREPY